MDLGGHAAWTAGRLRDFDVERLQLTAPLPLDEIYKADDADRALDILYAGVTNLVRAEGWDALDYALARVDLGRTSTDVAIGFLASTHPVRDRLPSRQRLLARIERWLPTKGKTLEQVQKILRGLR